MGNVDGSCWFDRQKGQSKPPLDFPHKNPFSSGLTLAGIIDEIKAKSKSWLGGVDFIPFLRNYKHWNRNTECFENVVEGTFDTNGHANDQYRTAIGTEMATLFLADPNTPFAAMAKEMLAPLGHSCMEALRAKTQHWYEFSQELDRKLALLVHWIGVVHLQQTSFVAATSALTDTASGHTIDELPNKHLLQLVSIWKLEDKNSLITLLGLQEEFEATLKMTNNVLTLKMLDRLGELLAQLARAPADLQQLVAHLPSWVMRRALQMTLRIDPEQGFYNKILLLEFQKHLYPILAESKYLDKVNPYRMVEWTNSVKKLLRETRIIDLQMAGTDYLGSPSRVAIASAAITDNNNKTPMRQGTPAASSGPPPTTPDNEPWDPRTCQFCEKDIPWGPGMTWSQHRGACTAHSRGRPLSPATCRTCQKPQRQCTCNRSRSRDRSDSRGRSTGRDDLSDANVGKQTWPQPPRNDQPRNNNNNNNRQRSPSNYNRRRPGPFRAAPLCTMLTALVISANLATAGALAPAPNLFGITENDLHVGALAGTSATISLAAQIATTGYTYALPALVGWLCHRDTPAKPPDLDTPEPGRKTIHLPPRPERVNNSTDKLVILLLAVLSSMLFQSPFGIPYTAKIRATYRLIHHGLLTWCMTATGLALLAAGWLWYNNSTLGMMVASTAIAAASTPNTTEHTRCRNASSPTLRSLQDVARWLTIFGAMAMAHALWTLAATTTLMTPATADATLTLLTEWGIAPAMDAIGLITLLLLTLQSRQALVHHMCLRVHQGFSNKVCRGHRLNRKAYLSLFLQCRDS
ncbi:hypothetical protein T484DRAFT_1868000 [Baffinella frigidus]|nr:hypothetical protein T484DRAFT_1868000 [Cryptophyta sp. CCMP2293]